MVLNTLLNLFSLISGRELFLLDSSLFVDDAEAYERYHREEPAVSEQKVILFFSLGTLYTNERIRCRRNNYFLLSELDVIWFCYFYFLV